MLTVAVYCYCDVLLIYTFFFCCCFKIIYFSSQYFLSIHILLLVVFIFFCSKQTKINGYDLGFSVEILTICSNGLYTYVIIYFCVSVRILLFACALFTLCYDIHDICLDNWRPPHTHNVVDFTFVQRVTYYQWYYKLETLDYDKWNESILLYIFCCCLIRKQLPKAKKPLKLFFFIFCISIGNEHCSSDMHMHPLKIAQLNRAFVAFIYLECISCSNLLMFFGCY